MPDDPSDLDTLANIARRVTPTSSVRQWIVWEQRRATTDFPERKRTVGKYVFYSVTEVTEWYTLWLKATGKMRGKHAALNRKAGSQ